MILAVNAGVLDVVAYLLHGSSGLELKFRRGILSLTRVIHAGKLTHVALTSVGNRDGFLENLSYVRCLRTGNVSRFGCGQRIALRNLGLRGSAERVLLIYGKFNRFGGFGRTDEVEKRCGGDTLGVKRTGVRHQVKVHASCHVYLR